MGSYYLNVSHNFVTLRSLHDVHKTKARKADSVCLSVCFMSKTTGRILIKFGTHVIPFEVIPNCYVLISYNQ
jgi:hypothetical protein